MDEPSATPPGAPSDRAIDDATLEALLARARAAWPTLPIPAPVAAAHMADKLAGLDRVPPAFHVEDLYLACGCALGLPAALSAFESRHLSEVKVFLGRMKPAPTLVDEVKQSLRVRLLVAVPGEVPRIAEYGGRGSLTAWLRVAAIRTAIDLLRQSGAPLPDDDGEPQAMLDRIPGDDPELELVRERYRGELADAVREAFSSLSAQQRNLLRLSYRDGRSIDEIAAVFGTHRATAARWIAAAREQILDETRRGLEARLRLRPHEFHSLLGVLRSRLQISVSRLLDAAD